MLLFIHYTAENPNLPEAKTQTHRCLPYTKFWRLKNSIILLKRKTLSHFLFTHLTAISPALSLNTFPMALSTITSPASLTNINSPVGVSTPKLPSGTLPHSSWSSKLCMTWEPTTVTLNPITSSCDIMAISVSQIWEWWREIWKHCVRGSQSVVWCVIWLLNSWICMGCISGGECWVISRVWELCFGRCCLGKGYALSLYVISRLVG